MADVLFEAVPRARRVLGDAAAWRVVASAVGAAESPRVARRQRPPQHDHGHRELLLALDGEVVYGLGEHAYRCTAGTWMVFEAFEPHDDGYAEPVGEFAHLWISVVHDSVFARVHAGRDRRRTYTPMLTIEATGETRRMIDEARALAATAPALARARLVGAFAGLAGRLLAAGATAPEARSDPIDAILSHVAFCAGKGVSIEHLARIAGYSPFHFARVFRRRTGRTVHAYVDECRRDAFADLRQQGLAHQAISDRLGFSCASAFSRWLRGQREAGLIAEAPAPRRRGKQA